MDAARTGGQQRLAVPGPSTGSSLQHRLSKAVRRTTREARRILDMQDHETVAYFEWVEEQRRTGSLSPEEDERYRRELLVRFPENSVSVLNDLTQDVRLTLSEPIDGGGYGDIYRGTWRGEDVAIKRFRRLQMEPEVFNRRFMEEVNISARMNCPRILRVYGFASVEGQLCLISQWMEGGNAFTYVKEHKDCDRLGILIDIAEGMDYLHNRAHIVHGDLRAVNILMSHKGRAVIADFGLSRRLRKVLEHMGTVTVGSRDTNARWVAPELLIGSAAEDKSYMTPYTDVWSFGMLCLELTTGRPPFAEVLGHHAVYAGLMQTPPLLPGRPRAEECVGLTDALWTLMLRCWSTTPNERPLMNEIVSELRAMQPDYSPSESTSSPTASTPSESPTMRAAMDDILGHPLFAVSTPPLIGTARRPTLDTTTGHVHGPRPPPSPRKPLPPPPMHGSPIRISPPAPPSPAESSPLDRRSSSESRDWAPLATGRSRVPPDYLSSLHVEVSPTNTSPSSTNAIPSPVRAITKHSSPSPSEASPHLRPPSDDWGWGGAPLPHSITALTIPPGPPPPTYDFAISPASSRFPYSPMSALSGSVSGDLPSMRMHAHAHARADDESSPLASSPESDQVLGARFAHGHVLAHSEGSLLGDDAGHAPGEGTSVSPDASLFSVVISPTTESPSVHLPSLYASPHSSTYSRPYGPDSSRETVPPIPLPLPAERPVILSSTEAYAVRAGNMQGLVRRLVASEHTRTAESEFRHVFWASYRAFTNADEFLGLLETDFDSENGIREDRRYWVLEVVKEWLEQGALDRDLSRWRILTMLEKIPKTDLLQRMRQQLADIIAQHTLDIGRDPTMPRKPESGETLAHALTQLEGEQIVRIVPGDCVAYLAEVPGDSPLRTALQMNANLVLWAKRTILQGNSWGKRVQMYNFFAEAAEACLSMGNFSSALALMDALRSDEIRELPMVKRYSNWWWQPSMRRLKKLSKDDEEYLKEFRSLNSSSKLRLRTPKRPCIPRLSIHLRLDLSLRGALEEASWITQDGQRLVNFAKWAAVTARVQEMLHIRLPRTRADAGVIAFARGNLAATAANKGIAEWIRTRGAQVKEEERLAEQRGEYVSMLGLGTEDGTRLVPPTVAAQT